MKHLKASTVDVLLTQGNGSEREKDPPESAFPKSVETHEKPKEAESSKLILLSS